MFWSSIRIAAALPRLHVKPVFAFTLAVLLTGCSARSEYGPSANVGMAGEARQVAVATPVKEEIEDDGLLAQRPPLMGRSPRPDNPNEPFSRNYGGPRQADAAVWPSVRAAAIPDDLPSDFRRRLIVANGQD